MKKTGITLLFVTTVLMFGCGSPKDASKSNFKKAINKHYQKDCESVSPGYSNFPVKIRVYDSKITESEMKPYDALASIGFLDAKEETEKGAAFFGKPPVYRSKVYSLTEKGKAALKNASPNKNFNNNFCVATLKVDEISNFTVPSAALGLTVSKVNYTVSPEKISDWANNPQIQKAFPKIPKILEKKHSASTDLVLMNDGWLHFEDMK